jgi:hypothetical protein
MFYAFKRFRRQLLGACGVAGVSQESLNREHIVHRGNSNHVTVSSLLRMPSEQLENQTKDLERAEKLLITSQNGTDELQLFRPSYQLWRRQMPDGIRLEDPFSTNSFP